MAVEKSLDVSDFTIYHPLERLGCTSIDTTFPLNDQLCYIDGSNASLV